MVTQQVSRSVGIRDGNPAPLVRRAVPSFLVAAGPAQLFLRGWALQLKSSAGAYQLYLYEVERMQGWNMDNSDLQLQGQMCSFI